MSHHLKYLIKHIDGKPLRLYSNWKTLETNFQVDTLFNNMIVWFTSSACTTLIMQNIQTLFTVIRLRNSSYKIFCL